MCMRPLLDCRGQPASGRRGAGFAEFSTGITSDVDAGIATVRVNSAGSRSAFWHLLRRSRTDGRRCRSFAPTGVLAGDSPAAVASEVARVEAIFNPMTAAAKSIVHVEAREAGACYQEALASYQSSLQLMLLVLVLGLVTAGGMVYGWFVLRRPERLPTQPSRQRSQRATSLTACCPAAPTSSTSWESPWMSCAAPTVR